MACRRLLASAWFLLVLPATVSGQPETFVQAAQALAQAAAQAVPDPTPLGAAGQRMGFALVEWDLAIETQETRTRRELGEAAARRQFELHVEMGVAYRTRGRLADALREFDAAAQLDPASSDLQLIRALTLESSGQTAGADRAYRAAWSLDTANPAKAYYVLQRTSNPGAEEIARARDVLSRAYGSLRSNASAPVTPPFAVLDALPDALWRVPVVGNARTGPAFALLTSGKYKEAMASLATAIHDGVGPADGPLRRFTQAQVDEKENRVSEARAGYTAALAGALSGRSVIYVAIGRLALVEGDVPGAVDAFSQAVRLNPNDATMRQELASAYAAAGRMDAAFAELVAGLMVNPANAALHAAIGQLRLDAGLPADAIPAFTRALELNPGGYEVRYALAMALARSGKPEEAATQLGLFEQARREMLERRRRDIQQDVDREDAIRRGLTDPGGNR